MRFAIKMKCTNSLMTDKLRFSLLLFFCCWLDATKRVVVFFVHSFLRVFLYIYLTVPVDSGSILIATLLLACNVSFMSSQRKRISFADNSNKEHICMMKPSWFCVPKCVHLIKFFQLLDASKTHFISSQWSLHPCERRQKTFILKLWLWVDWHQQKTYLANAVFRDCEQSTRNEINRRWLKKQWSQPCGQNTVRKFI